MPGVQNGSITAQQEAIARLEARQEGNDIFIGPKDIAERTREHVIGGLLTELPAKLVQEVFWPDAAGFQVVFQFVIEAEAVNLLRGA